MLDFTVTMSIIRISEHNRLDFGALLKSIIGNLKSIIGSSLLSSLSTLVLNSRDWSEIVWLPKISHLKINLAIGFVRKKPAGMHWLGYNDAVSWLNEAKT